MADQPGRLLLDCDPGPGAAVEKISSGEYPTPARRPLNSRLDTSKIEAVFGIKLPDWRVSLRETLADCLKAECV